jgi:hypothetical protein
MRLAVVAVVSILAVCAAASAAPAASAKCSTTLTVAGHRWIVVSSLSCAAALPIARRLPTARVIRRVTSGGVTVLKLEGPAGWTCATSTTTRNRGASCVRNNSAGAVQVTIVRIG